MRHSNSCKPRPSHRPLPLPPPPVAFRAACIHTHMFVVRPPRMQRTALSACCVSATHLALSFRCRLSQCWHARHRRGTVACSTRRVLQVGRSELGCDEWRNVAQYRSSALCVPGYRPVYPNGRGGDHPTGGVGKPPQPRTNDPLVHFQSGHSAPAQPAPLRPHGNRTRSRREESTLIDVSA
jgi:hypothetical protein